MDACDFVRDLRERPIRMTYTSRLRERFVPVTYTRVTSVVVTPGGDLWHQTGETARSRV